MFYIWRKIFNCVRSAHKNYHLCVYVQILVKYSKCKFTAFEREINSFKSGTLNASNIISCRWLNQAVKKQQAQLWWGLVPFDTADHPHQGFTNLAAPQDHQEAYSKVLIPRKKDKEINTMRKKGSTEDRSQGLTQRFQKDKKQRPSL